MISKPRRVTCAVPSLVAATIGLGLVGGSRHAYALGPDSTMSEWNSANAAERKSLLESLGPGLTPSFKAREAEILDCLNSAAQASAHADLPIGDIAKACAAADDAPASPDQSKDI